MLRLLPELYRYSVRLQGFIQLRVPPSPSLPLAQSHLSNNNNNNNNEEDF